MTEEEYSARAVERIKTAYKSMDSNDLKEVKDGLLTLDMYIRSITFGDSGGSLAMSSDLPYFSVEIDEEVFQDKLLKFLSHEDSEIRKDALHLLLHCSDNKSLSAVIKFLSDQRNELDDKKWALWVLERIGGIEVMDFLVRAIELADYPDEIRSSCHYSIKQLNWSTLRASPPKDFVYDEFSRRFTEILNRYKNIKVPPEDELIHKLNCFCLVGSLGLIHETHKFHNNGGSVMRVVAIQLAQEMNLRYFMKDAKKIAERQEEIKRDIRQMEHYNTKNFLKQMGEYQERFEKSLAWLKTLVIQ